MEGNEMVVAGGVAELAMRSPETVLAEAEMVAKALKKKADQLQLYKQIGASKHLRIEGWQMVGAMFRVAARVVETRFLDYGQARGFEAVAEAYHIPTGQVVGRAEAMCLSDEENWGLRPKYEKDEAGGKTTKVLAPVPLQQLRSMAQTRACSKVLSNLFKWIATMGGFAGTPAEEMTEGGESSDPQAPQRKPAANGSNKISEAQAKRIWGIGHGAGLSKDQIIALLKKWGFETAADVTKDKYEALCADVQSGGKQGPAPQKPTAKPPDKLYDFADWDRAQNSPEWGNEFIRVAGATYRQVDGNYQEFKQ